MGLPPASVYMCVYENYIQGIISRILCMQSIHFVTELQLHPLINIFKGLDFILTCILYFERFFFLYRHGCESSWVLKGRGASSYTTFSPFPLRQVLLTFFSAVEASKPNHPSVSPPLFSELKAVCWIPRLLYRC